MRRPDRPERLEPDEAKAIGEHVRKAVELAGLDVVELRVFGDRRVRVMIDVVPGAGAPAGAILGPGAPKVTIADCERASRAAQAGLTVAGVEPGDFELDVESPGADRPLTRERDLERFEGEQVTVTLKVDRDGRRNFTGQLVGHEGSDVTVHVLDTEAPETFKAADVKEIRLHPDMKLRPRE
jgi:ribosome maturation factor RimP